jgi:tRNA 2-thiouridine synthesizing protein A
VSPSARIDIRPFACPLTWVKTRVALERLDVGQVLEVWVSAGEPLASVPRSAAEDGHRLVALERLAAEPGESWRLLLEKGAPSPALL